MRELHSIEAPKYITVGMHRGSSLYVSPDTEKTSSLPTPSVFKHDENHIVSLDPYQSIFTLKTAGVEARLRERIGYPPSFEYIFSTFSGFRRLKSLSVLDMDTLDYIMRFGGAYRTHH